MSIEIMRTLIDPTSFAYIKGAVMQKRHGLSGIILVTEKADLADVAHVCESGDMPRWDALIEERAVKFVVSPGQYEKKEGLMKELSRPWNDIKDSAAVECILLPPFYIVKLAGKEWK